MRGHFDAVIVGAGPAGSAAAIVLARSGWSVALIEKQRFPRRKVCGECIAASNFALLDSLGIGEAFHNVAGPELRTVGLMRGAQQVIAELPVTADSHHRWGRALGREVLDTLLVERARSVGAVVLQPWSVRSLEGSAGDWHCEVRATDSPRGEMTLQAPIAIAAHGSWEALPGTQPSRRPDRRPSDLIAFKANFDRSAQPEGLLSVLSFDGGYGGMVVGDGGVTTLACCIRADRLGSIRRDLPGASAGEAIEALLRRECLGVRNALAGSVRNGTWLAAGPIAPGTRLRRDDRLLRIGNAAGEAHPIVGEGMSMALQSAWMLCDRLLALHGRERRGDAAWQSSVAREYAAQWHRQFGLRLKLAAMFAHAAASPALGPALLALASCWPGLLRRGAHVSGKVHCAVDPSSPAGSQFLIDATQPLRDDPVFDTGPAPSAIPRG
jgi:flavin-dependent dehydrogenase